MHEFILYQYTQILNDKMSIFLNIKDFGGERGIRTLDTVTRITP